MVFYDIFANGIFTTVLVLESIIFFYFIYGFCSNLIRKYQGVDLLAFTQSVYYKQMTGVII